MKDEIKRILKQTISYRPPIHILGEGLQDAKINGINAAADGIAELFEQRRPNRIQAMASLVEQVGHNVYEIAGNEVAVDEDGPWCCCCNADDCEHVQAVKLWLKWQGDDDA